MHPMFHAFERRDLIVGQRVRDRKVMDSRAEDLLQAVYEVHLATQVDSAADLGLPFSFVASSSIAGGREVCSHLQCRVHRARGLAEFAVLVADRVFIRNPLMPLLAFPEHPGPSTLDELKSALLDDLRVLLSIRPLIEAGLVVPVSTPVVCSHCVSISVLANDTTNSLLRSRRTLADRIIAECRLGAFKSSRGYTLAIEGPEELIRHGGVAFTRNEPHAVLKKRPSLLKRVDAGEQVQLSTTALRESDYPKQIAATTFDQVVFDLVSTRVVRGHLIGDHTGELDMATSLGASPTTSSRSRLPAQLKAMLPCLRDVPPDKIVTVRERQGDSFISFRAELLRAVKDYADDSGQLTDERASDIWVERIEPQLAAYRQSVEQSKRGLITSTAIDTLGWASVLTLWAALGLLKLDPSSVAAAVGLSTVVGAATNVAKQALTTPAPSPVAFLWEVSKKADGD